MSPQPRRAPNPNTVSATDHAMLRRLVHQRVGLVIEPGKEYFVEMRLGALAIEEGFASIPDVLEALRTEETWGVLHRLVAESLAIAETSWFRDLHLWEELRRSVLPELVRARSGEKDLRLWSAACASGQEAYSLAMLVREHFPLLAGWRTSILATDFSAGSLRRCREGRYSQIEMNRGLPAPYLVKYFRKEGHEWVMREDMRTMIETRELNLSGPWPALPPMDLVLLRNLLIYFDRASRKHVLGNLARLLRPGGYLVLGGGETTLTLDDSFEPVTVGRTLMFRLRPSAAS